ncbi:MAG: response regulator [Deltaproteobacteria bacterium]|nr:response regulator [Deltaproteobacteria bacterium]
MGKSISSKAEKAMSGRILVVDDDESIQDVVAGFLEVMGFDVVLAGNGIEALAVFIGNSFDMVLTDLRMPAMDGLSLAGHIKKRSPSTPVILLTGSDREDVLKKVEGGPFCSVIFKPFKMLEFQKMVRGALVSG